MLFPEVQGSAQISSAVSTIAASPWPTSRLRCSIYRVTYTIGPSLVRLHNVRDLQRQRCVQDQMRHDPGHRLFLSPRPLRDHKHRATLPFVPLFESPTDYNLGKHLHSPLLCDPTRSFGFNLDLKCDTSKSWLLSAHSTCWHALRDPSQNPRQEHHLQRARACLPKGGFWKHGLKATTWEAWSF